MLMVLKSGGFTPRFEKDDCRDAGGTSPRKGEGDRVGNTRSITPRMGEVNRVRNKRSKATQGAIADDCKEAGGRQCRSYSAEGPGEIE
jgi:hypothetical protein